MLCKQNCHVPHAYYIQIHSIRTPIIYTMCPCSVCRQIVHVQYRQRLQLVMLVLRYMSPCIILIFYIKFHYLNDIYHVYTITGLNNTFVVQGGRCMGGEQWYAGAFQVHSYVYNVLEWSVYVINSNRRIYIHTISIHCWTCYHWQLCADISNLSTRGKSSSKEHWQNTPYTNCNERVQYWRWHYGIRW